MSSYSEGQTHQLMDALEGIGYTPAQITMLGQNSNGVLNQLILVLTGAAKIVTDLFFRLVPIIDRDMTNWECVEPVETKETNFEPVLQEFLQKEDNGFIDGESMIKRAKEKGISAGLRHAEAMLRNQERIPVEWQKHCLVFPEVWQGPHRRRYVFCLSWYGNRWGLHYYWLGSGFNSDGWLVASRKYQK